MQGFRGFSRFRESTSAAVRCGKVAERTPGDETIMKSGSWRGAPRLCRCAIVWLFGLGLAYGSYPAAALGQWNSYGRNSQHTALAAGPSQVPASIRWSIAIDQDPQYSGSELLIHYGSPVITEFNNILVPVKTGAAGGFQVTALKASTGKLIWSFKTDYVLPPHNWTPPMGITLIPGGTEVAIPGSGGTVWIRNNPDSQQGNVRRLAFYGSTNYNQDPQGFNNAIQICTPITSDEDGNLYFGYLSSGAALYGYPNGIPSGLARVTLGGKGSFVAASVLANDANIQKVVYNCTRP